MVRTISSLARHVSFAMAAAITLLALAGALWIDHLERQRLEALARNEISSQLNILRSGLESELTGSLLLSRGVAAYVTTHGDITRAEFDKMAATLLGDSTTGRNITLTRGTVIAMVYPNESNQAAIGFDLRTKPEMWTSAERAIQTRAPNLNGPVTLVQGGSAVILRNPIFVPDGLGGDDRFFGFVNVIVEIDNIFGRIRRQAEGLNLDVAIRGRDGLGAGGDMVLGDKAIFAQAPVLTEVTLPYGTFLMAAVPKSGWDLAGQAKLRILRLLSAATILLVGLATFGLAFHQWRRHRDEEAIRLRLEAEIADRTERLEESLVVAQQANSAKTLFLATMSHEIRTPLGGVIGMADLLLDAPLPRDQYQHVQTIRASARALLTVVDDILDLTKLDAGKIVIETAPFRLRQVLDDIELILRPRAAERGLNFSVKVAKDVPEAVMGDGPRLRQILLNLGSNAIKFTESGEVTVRVVTEGNDHLRFEVEDTGIGIDETTRGRLFEEFFQADGGLQHGVGSGMGLNISRRLVELMGGSVTVDSHAGRGSTFRVVLPLTAAAPPTSVDPSPAQTPLPPLKVLVAEDNPVNATVLATIVRRAGHQVTVVGDGRAAVEAASTQDFDIILMDMRMPLLDGLAATRTIRALPNLRGRVPILGVTANAFKEDQQSCLDAGMDGYVSKPVTAERLFAAIHAAFEPTSAVHLPC